MKKLFQNKKAATMDNLLVLIKVFGFAFFILIMFLVWDNLTTAKLNSEIWGKTTEGISIRNNTTLAINNMDFIFLVAYFGLHIGIIVLAYMLRSHPVVFIVGIFIIIILVMIAAPLSNVWEEVSQQDDFIVSAAKMPKADFIMGLLPIFEMIFAFITLIVFAAFAKGDF